MEIIPDSYIVVNGYKTRYWQLGQSGSVLLLLHGFAFSVEVWEHNIKELAKQHIVIALDLLGFGLSDKPKNKQKVEEFPIFVYDFLRALKIDSLHIIGHSMGGLIALRFTQLFKEMVESLTLISSAGLDRKIPIHFRLFSLPLLGEFFVQPNKQGLQSALRKNVFYQHTDLTNLSNKLYEYSLHPEMAKTLLNVCRAAINIFGFKRKIIKTIAKEMTKVTCPVLIIWGENDCIIYVDHAYKAHKMLKNAQLEIFPACGHLPQFEYPQKFNEIVSKFISNKKL